VHTFYDYLDRKTEKNLKVNCIEIQPIPLFFRSSYTESEITYFYIWYDMIMDVILILIRNKQTENRADNFK
jgi:hypothetical protein